LQVQGCFRPKGWEFCTSLFCAWILRAGRRNAVDLGIGRVLPGRLFRRYRKPLVRIVLRRARKLENAIALAKFLNIARGLLCNGFVSQRQPATLAGKMVEVLPIMSAKWAVHKGFSGFQRALSSSGYVIVYA